MYVYAQNNILNWSWNFSKHMESLVTVTQTTQLIKTFYHDVFHLFRYNKNGSKSMNRG